jgi:hypothetical protein
MLTAPQADHCRATGNDFGKPLTQGASQIAQRAYIFDPSKKFRRAHHACPAGHENADRAIPRDERKRWAKFRYETGEVGERAMIDAVAMHEQGSDATLGERTPHMREPGFIFAKRQECRIPIVWPREERSILHTHRRPVPRLCGKDGKRGRLLA